LNKWQPYPTFIPTGSARNRAQTIFEFEQWIDCGETAWLVVNPDMCRFRAAIKHCPWHHSLLNDGKKVRRFEAEECPQCEVTRTSPYPLIHELEWSNVVIDECHRNAVRNPKTLTAKGMYDLKVKNGGKRIPQSGTLLGGKPINMWGILHFCNPVAFASKWRWADQWLTIEDNGYGKKIGAIKPWRKEEFYKSLDPYLLRRTKAEALPWLPPKQRIDVPCEMVEDQHRQYERFAAEAEIKIAEDNISATSVLAEYTRLKQFANAKQFVRPDDHKLVPVRPMISGKLLALMERLDEEGIIEGDGEEQAVIFSQFSEMVDAVYSTLVDAGVPTLKITGSTNKRGERAQIQKSFQKGEARVCIMTTTAGGVAITLDRASYVHILDETWDPDNEEQAEDRCHRASRIHQVTVYRYYSKGTVEEYIREVTGGKRLVNEDILDLRRQIRVR